MRNELFLEYDIGQLHALLEKGELRPSDLVDACAERTRAMDGRFHVWECFDVRKLQEQAVRLENMAGHRGALAYIPVAVKDIFNTRLFPTQMGSALWKDFTPGNDARIVYNLTESGAIIAGKSVTAEFAVHALNKTLNPHDITRTPGTSSSGSAAAIALGITPVAMGTQTAGSIVRPASFCGIYGFKPSFGLLPRTGMLKTTDSLDTVGFFTVHYRDLRRVLDSIRVRGRNYPLSDGALSDAGRQTRPPGRPWKVAFIKTYTWDKAEPYAKESMTQYVGRLSKHKDIEVQEVSLGREFDRCHGTHAAIYNKTLSYYFQNEYSNATHVSEIMVRMIEEGKKISPQQYLEALKAQSDLCVVMDNLMQDYDVLISLSTAGIAPPRNVMEKDDPSLIWTMMHLPALSVPSFRGPGGLPFGFQVCARKYNDYLLLNFLDDLYGRELIPSKANTVRVNRDREPQKETV